MKTKAWAVLVHHLVFLFIFLELASGISLWIAAGRCKEEFVAHQILPVNMKVDRSVFYVTSDIIFTIYGAYGMLGSLLAIYAFFGVVNLQRYGLVNFTAGIGMVFVGFLKVTGTWGLTYMTNSFDKLIVKEVVDLFETSRGFNWFLNASMDIHYGAFFTLPFFEGWTYGCDGTFDAHMEIDYMQINLQCCGLTGRGFYRMHVPRSCCSEKYPGYKCILDVAYSKNCLQDYRTFIDSTSTLKTEMFVFGCISFFTAVNCLYLSYLSVYYPDGDYKSDHSSDEDEFA